MAQIEVYNFLKKNSRAWFTTKQISESLGTINRQSITVNCNKLRKFKLIDSRKSNNNGYRELEYKYIRK